MSNEHPQRKEFISPQTDKLILLGVNSVDATHGRQDNINLRIGFASTFTTPADAHAPFGNFCDKWCRAYSWRCSYRETCQYNWAVRRK